MIRLSLPLVLASLSAPALAAPPVASPFPMPRPERSASAPAAVEVQATTLPRIVVEVIDESAPEAETAAPLDIAALAGDAIAEADGETETAEPEISPLATATSPFPTPRGDVPPDFLALSEERGRA